MIRLQNGPFLRIVHYNLYQRMLDFAVKYSPELPAEPIIDGWINRLFSNDDTLHIIANFEAHTITEHAVIDVQQAYGCRIIVCHQTQHDKPSLTTLDEGMEYIHKLAVEVNASAIIFFAEEHSEAFMKRYGFTIGRTMMVKRL